jgi:hypothetical protein
MMRWMWLNDSPANRASRKRSTRMPFSSGVTVTVWTAALNGAAGFGSSSFGAATGAGLRTTSAALGRASCFGLNGVRRFSGRLCRSGRPGLSERPGFSVPSGVSDRPRFSKLPVLSSRDAVSERPGLPKRLGASARPDLSGRPCLSGRLCLSGRFGLSERPGFAGRPRAGPRGCRDDGPLAGDLMAAP